MLPMPLATPAIFSGVCHSQHGPFSAKGQKTLLPLFTREAYGRPPDLVMLDAMSSRPIYRFQCSPYQHVGALEGGVVSAWRCVLVGGVCLDGCRLSTGSVKKKVVPSPGCDSAQIRTPCA